VVFAEEERGRRKSSAVDNRDGLIVCCYEGCVQSLLAV